MSDEYDSGDENLDVPTEQKQAPKGVGTLSVGLKLSNEGKKQKDEQEKELLGDETTILFQLPNQEVKKHSVNMGRPIEWLKLLVQKEHGIPFEQQEMYIQGQDAELPNVFCLQDIPSIKANSENIIIVKQK
ncbi:hypothetical protein ABK040_007227 [Willaertia magna]